MRRGMAALQQQARAVTKPSRKVYWGHKPACTTLVVR
jgi:hypothetical protein